MVDREQVVLPLLIDRLQHDHLDQVIHQFVTELLETGIEKFRDLIFQNFSEVVRGKPGDGLVRKIDLDRKCLVQCLGYPLPVPLMPRNLVNGICRDNVTDRLVKHLHEAGTNLLPGKNLLALGVDDLALLVHDIVIVDEMFSDLEVMSLDLFLGILYRFRNHAVRDRLALFDLQDIHDLRDPLRTEYPQEIILQRKIEARRSRISLASGTTPELVIDTSRFMPLCSENMKSAQAYHLDVLIGTLVLVLGQD